MTLPNSTIQWCTKMSSDEIWKKVNLSRGLFCIHTNAAQLLGFLRFSWDVWLIVENGYHDCNAWKICHIFDRLHYRVDIKREIVKNPFIYHSFKAMNDFSLKNAVSWFSTIDIIPLMRPIKHIANFLGNTMVISIFYHEQCISRK